MRLRVLIAEDESLARERLVKLLNLEENVEITSVCRNGREAFHAIQTHSPDVVFLDIQMPDLSGFALLDSLPALTRPLIVFVTAHEKYALRAFDADAADYLLKPFDRERLRRTLAKVRNRIESRRASEMPERLATLRQRLTGAPKPPGQAARISLKEDGRILLLKPDEIEWLAADNNHVELRAGESRHRIRSTLGSLESRLPKNQFLRISRSTIINLARLKEVMFDRHGDGTVIMQSGAKLALSRSHRSQIDQILANDSKGETSA